MLLSIQAFSKKAQVINLPKGEKIWSGAIKEGHKMPFENEPGFGGALGTNSCADAHDAVFGYSMANSRQSPPRQ